MKPIQFMIPIPPTAKRRHRSRVVAGKFIQTYNDPKSKLETDTLGYLLLEHRPPEPLEGPLEVFIKAYLKIPLSFSKKKVVEAIRGSLRPTGKPDTDNLGKQVMDCMNQIFWRDDAQVVSLTVSKWYGAPARWEISIFRPVLTILED